MARRGQQPLEHRMLLTATFCLLAAGAVMVYSASSARTLLESGGDGTAYLVKYLVYGAIGLVALHVIARSDLERVRRLTPLLLLGSFALLVLVPLIGRELNGATRWLAFGPLQFQPAEIMKLALVLHAAAALSAKPKKAPSLRRVAGPIFLPTGCAVVLIAVQPDLGTILVIGFTIGAMLVAAGLPIRQLGLIVGACALLVSIFALSAPYRRARLTSFLDPWAYASQEGFQSVQGLIAIGSGGLFGLGPGESVQKIFYLPEAHTDFILAVIGEELGVAGIAVLLTLYGMIAYAGLLTAKAARGAYAKLLAAGLTSLILCQALLNIYTVLGLAPLTGVPLPFISSGSSSLITLLMSMGLLLNIANGGTVVLRAVRGPNERERAAGRDRRGRDRRTRRAGASGSRRAAG